MSRRKKTVFCVTGLLILCWVSLTAQNPDVFKVKKLSEKVIVLNNTTDNVSQIAIVSNSGIVVLDSFWSTVTADKFRKQWEKFLKRNDFIYTINTVDRLDIFGGNATYKDTTIIGHSTFREKFTRKAVADEIKRLIEMWRWKEDVSRKRLPTHQPGSKEEKGEKKWLKTCKQRADELENGFVFLPPQVVYNDRMALDLGDITVRLISFGKAGFDGMSIVVIPEEKLVVIPGFIVHVHHLAPHPHSSFTELDVPRWIAIFEEILNGTSAVEKFVCGSDLWPKARVAAHLKYIKTLWERVAELEKAGKDLAAVQKILSMDTEFSFVKKMNVYLDYGDDWVRPQHLAHVKGFFLQHKKMGTALVRKMMKQMTAKEALQKVLALKKKDNAVYLDESTLNGLGYELMGTGKIADAIEVLETVVKMYPRSANAYDSLAEGYMKSGNNKLAIKNYKISLKLNPKNKNAETMLKKLKN